jgi:7-keto-8-aminopelargonate synthetase-like enzyme
MDGLAPLDKIVILADKYDAMVMVDGATQQASELQ